MSSLLIKLCYDGCKPSFETTCIFLVKNFIRLSVFLLVSHLGKRLDSRRWLFSALAVILAHFVDAAQLLRTLGQLVCPRR